MSDEAENAENEPDLSGAIDEFEGEEFTRRELSLKADLALALGLDGTYRRGTKLVVIGTFAIDEIQHKTKANKPTRVEKGSATELFIVSDSTDALDLLQQARLDRQTALDELLGGGPQLPFDDQPDNVTPIREPGSSSEVTGMTDEEFEASLHNLIDDEEKGEGEFQDDLDDLVEKPDKPDDEAPKGD